MRIITGKQWIEKTKYYINESLDKEAIWLVPSQMKYDYEYDLLKASKNNAYLNQRVMTFNELFEELKAKQQLFLYHTITLTESYLLIYQLLKSYHGKIIKGYDLGTIKQLHHVFQQFHQYQSDLDKIMDVDLPSFSTQKLLECKELFDQYKQYLKERNWIMENDYPILSVLEEDVCFYIDQHEHLTPLTWSFIKQLKHCTLLLTYDQTDDSYTHFVKKQLVGLDFEKVDFVTGSTSYEKHHRENFQNLKASTYLETGLYRGIKAMNKQIEMNKIAIEIFNAIVNQKADYQDFGIYCTHQEDIIEMKKCLEKHDLPAYAHTLESVNHVAIYRLVINFLDYVLMQDDIYILAMLESGLVKKKINPQTIDYYEKLLKTTGSIDNEEFYILKQEIDLLAEDFKNKKTAFQKAELLYQYMISLEINYQDEEDIHYYHQMLSIIESFFIEMEIDQESFIRMFNEQCTLTKIPHPLCMDRINLTSNTFIQNEVKFVYIIGCDEGAFPTISSDNQLILNDELLASRDQGLNLGESLFEKIEAEYLNWFKVFSLERQYILTYPTGSLGGDEFLASSLYLALKKCWAIKEEVWSGDYQLSDVTTLKASKEIVENYIEDSWVNHLVNDYEVHKNQPTPISVELLNQLVKKNHQTKISPSELETYNGCPFKYYVRYGLGIYKWRDWTFQASDFGNIVHDTLNILTKLYKGDKTLEDYMKDYHIEDIHSLYDTYIYPDICSEKLETDDKALLLVIYHIATNEIDICQLSSSQRYLFNKLVHDLFNTVKMVYYHVMISDFKIVDHEAKKERIHAIATIHGRVDRVDEYHDFIKVVDYKSSQKELDLCLATLGFNMQMLLYLDMLTQDKRKGGVLYFNTKQRILKMEEKTEEDLFEDILELYRQEGFILNDEEVIKAIDKVHEPSVVTQLKYVKSKGTYSGNTLDKTQFDELINRVNQHVDSLLERIYQEADIRIMPSHHDVPKINMQVNPCTYCDYQSVCLKDVFYNEAREIEYLDKKTMLKILGGESDD